MYPYMQPPQFQPQMMTPPPQHSTQTFTDSPPVNPQPQSSQHHSEGPVQVDANTSDPWLSPEESRTKRKSEVWAYFVLSRDNTQAKCKTCGKIFSAKTTGGTGHLLRHGRKCGEPASDPSQPRISATYPSGFVYNYERDRDELGKMLVHSETPFLFSENDAFNRYITTALQPQHKKIGRKTVSSSAMTKYLQQKEKLKYDLGSTTARVSLTADAWDGGYGLHYLCVTCHWVDRDWLLQKRIIHFKMLEWPHTGVNIAHHLMEAIDAYGLRERIMCMTFDNASSMTYMANLVKNNLREYVLDEDSLHVRCACHVLNLCVQDGVRAIGPYHEKIRHAVLCINSSGLRLQEWKAFLRQCQLRPVKIKADCSTRWNSTYEMLSKAITYKEPLTRFFNSRFPQHALSDDDWVKCEKYMAFLSLLYSMTHCFSTVYQPCAQSFLPNACLLANLFNQYRFSSDYDDYLPAMEEKWRKYYSIIPDIYIYACILDPRHKYEGTYTFIDIYYDAMQVETLNMSKEDYKNQVTDKFFHLFQVYETKYGTIRTSVPPSQSRQSGKKSKGLWGQVTNMVSKYQVSAGADSSRSRRSQSDVSELQMYMSYDFTKGMSEEDKCGLDLMEWWKEQAPKHPILAAMARDIFAIQVSSVASERAFSASGRVLDDRRTRLKPETLEMCVCYKDWLDAEHRAQDQTYEANDNDDTDATSTSSTQASQLADELEEAEEDED